jgi:hypothetical protein
MPGATATAMAEVALASSRRGDGPPPPLPAALEAALSVILPDDTDTALLRACLLRDGAGRDAWAECLRRIPDLVALFKDDVNGRKRLGPLLLSALSAYHGEAPQGLLTALRMARLREELRAREYRRICFEALACLDEAGVPCLVLKGAALGELVYRDPVLRHAHDINLLLERHDLDRAAALLAREGLSPVHGAGRAGGSATLIHPSGLPVVLQTELFQIPLYRIPGETLWARSRPTLIAGRSTRVLSPEDTLVHALGHASYCPTRTTLQWAADAHLLLARQPDFDWDYATAAAARARLALSQLLQLRYLADVMGALVPRTVLTSLGRTAAAVRPIERDAALFGARHGRGKMLVPRSWRARLAVARWSLFPSPAYLRWAYGARSMALLPFYYGARPFTWAAEKLYWRWRRLRQGGVRP